MSTNLYRISISCVMVLILITLNSCIIKKSENNMKNYNLKSTMEIFVTSEDGDKIAKKENVPFKKGIAEGRVIRVRPEILKQTIDGIGSSFTESSAFVLAHLDDEKRCEVMEKIFSEDGANFSLTRTHIGACDFCVDGKYSYADVADDKMLKHFDISPDTMGFDSKRFPGIKNQTYDLLPMIHEALKIKMNQKDKDLRIVASAWTAPSWMKDIEGWYVPGSADNNWQGSGGVLKNEYVSVYADYIVKYLDAYKNEGVPVWGITPVNEPHGNSGQWESMHFSPETQNDFIKNHLGPKLKDAKLADTRILIFDQNRDGLEHWTEVIFNDKETAQYIYGAAVHWYESTFKVYEEVFDRVHQKFPDFSIIHTEGCIDDLGKEAPGGIGDPVKFKESGWFDNDEFWWNDNATDWGYTAPWAGDKVDDHPIYTPVHRYARNIIVSIDHWLKGWIDWNVVLDKDGGPNHVGNFCGAPIMIDTENQYVYYTPIYYVLAQFSRSIRPGDRAVQTEIVLDGLNSDAIHTCATLNSKNILSVQLLNTTKEAHIYNLEIGNQVAEIEIPANSVQTVRVQLHNSELNAEMLINKNYEREEPFVTRQFEPNLDGKWIGNAISYGCYREGQAPGDNGPAEHQILEDLNILSEHWNLVRVYGADDDSEKLLRVIDEYKLPFKVMLGIWLEREENNPDHQKANQDQVLKGIELANKYQHLIAGVNVGNEALVFWSGHRMELKNMTRYIRAVREHTTVPVTTADDYNFWNKEESKIIAAEVDFIVTHIYPLWNGKNLDNAISWMDTVYNEQIKEMHPNKTIVLGEIGWATTYNPHKTGPSEQGTLIKAEVSLNAQKTFLENLNMWIEQNKVTTFFFEAFDEPWKGGGLVSEPDEVEKHWGVYYKNREIKPSFDNFLKKKKTS